MYGTKIASVASQDVVLNGKKKNLLWDSGLTSLSKSLESAEVDEGSVFFTVSIL